MKNLHIRELSSGGMITNYFCTSACRHCFYGCSPSWAKNIWMEIPPQPSFEKSRNLAVLPSISAAVSRCCDGQKSHGSLDQIFFR